MLMSNGDLLPSTFNDLRISSICVLIEKCLKKPRLPLFTGPDQNKPTDVKCVIFFLIIRS